MFSTTEPHKSQPNAEKPRDTKSLESSPSTTLANPNNTRTRAASDPTHRTILSFLISQSSEQKPSAEKPKIKFPSINTPSYTEFAKISKHLLKQHLFVNMSTDNLIKYFENIQGRLIIEKMLLSTLLQMINLYLAFNYYEGYTKKLTALTIITYFNFKILCNFMGDRQIQHNLAFVELYQRYKKLVQAGPETTNNPEATKILTVIHTELNLDQMEPWKTPGQKTDYSKVSEIYREIIGMPPHGIKFDSRLSVRQHSFGLLHRAANYLVFATSLMRETESDDHINEFKCK